MIELPKGTVFSKKPIAKPKGLRLAFDVLVSSSWIHVTTTTIEASPNTLPGTEPFRLHMIPSLFFWLQSVGWGARTVEHPQLTAENAFVLQDSPELAARGKHQPPMSGAALRHAEMEDLVSSCPQE